jgi:RimJ/RimL family protein N-acetyltransferase
MDSAHVERTHEWLQDPSLRAQVDTLEAPTREQNAAYWRARLADPTREDYAVLDGDGVHVGNCGLANLDRPRAKAELWIYLGQRRGAGLGQAAARRLISRAFDELRLNRVYVRVLATNAGAERFFRALGFVPEGRWREDTLVNQSFVDSLWLSLLARERSGHRLDP